MSNPKLTDVAQLAGVSPATVSRAINQPAIVNVKTLERIQQAIQQIGYETNTAGRNLRLRRSDALLVMISDAPSRFFSQILMGVEAEASKAGYNVLVSNTQDNPERGRQLYASIQQSLADGILTFGRHNPELGDLIRNHPIPIVGVNEHLEELPVPVTTVDNLSASRGNRSSSARVRTSEDWACDRHHYLVFGQRSPHGIPERIATSRT